MNLDSMIEAARASRAHLDDERRAAILARALDDDAPGAVTPLADAPVAPRRRGRVIATVAAGVALAAAVALLIVKLGAFTEPAPPTRSERTAPVGVPPPPPPGPQDRIVPRAPPPPPKVVSPMTLESYRTSGDKNIHPDEATKRAMARADVEQVSASIKLCVDRTGLVSTVKLVNGTGFEAYDARLMAGVRTWTYRPVLVDGVAADVCSVLAIIYSQR
jgi:hypothetical protein